MRHRPRGRWDWPVLWVVCLLTLHGLCTPSLAEPPVPSLLSAFDEVLQRVVHMRQLPLRGPIQRAVRNRQEIRAAVLVLAQEAYTPEEWETERKAMVQWGLLSPDFPLKDYVLELLTEQAAGYYDPKQRMFFIADWLPQLVQKPVMAHELVHALQDQHYNLQKNFDLVKDHADLTLARKALIEGDATAAMFLYLLEPIGLQIDDIPDMQTLLQMGGALLGEQFQVYNRAPLILRQQLLFPYVHGLAFVKAALARGGWPGLRRVYQRPPVSTQHILHPETYFAEPPVLPQDLTPHLPDDLLGSAWSKRKRDTLGEFLLSVVLQQFLPEDEARQSVVGWRGDHYVLFEQPDTGRLLLVSVSAWESPKAAHAFFQSYSKLLAVKYPGWTQQPLQEAGGYVWHQDTKRLLLRQQHRFVQIIEGAQQEDLLRLQPLLERVAEPSAQPR